MSRNHVRFSRTTMVHSPDTPSTCSGSLTPVSSSRPLAQPAVGQGLPGPSPYMLTHPSGYPMPPPQHMYPAHVRAHHLLEPSSMFFDMVDHPSCITYHHRLVSSRVMSEPAFSQPIRTTMISVGHLPWKIPISASNDSYLTVHDVLHGIYKSLRNNIAPAEFSALPTPQDKQRATLAYEHRYWRLRNSSEYEEEKRRGMKRIDFLMEMTRFAGLSGTNYGPDAWVLNYA